MPADMPTLNDILEQPPTIAPLHPKVRHWAELIRQGAEVRLEVFRPATTLGLSQGEINLYFTKADKTQLHDWFPWNDVFNSGLVELHVRAIDKANEIERFALSLRGALRKVESEFGDGFFNSVLYELVTESDLTRYPAIAEIIKHAFAIQLNHGGAGYNDCRELIASAIASRKYELEHLLRYSAEEAQSILVDALAKYLDERFSVSNRRRLGLLA